MVSIHGKKFQIPGASTVLLCKVLMKTPLEVLFHQIAPTQTGAEIFLCAGA